LRIPPENKKKSVRTENHRNNDLSLKYLITYWLEPKQPRRRGRNKLLLVAFVDSGPGESDRSSTAAAAAARDLKESIKITTQFSTRIDSARERDGDGERPGSRGSATLISRDGGKTNFFASAMTAQRASFGLLKCAVSIGRARRRRSREIRTRGRCLAINKFSAPNLDRCALPYEAVRDAM
jgi:hypothetical protein